MDGRRRANQDGYAVRVRGRAEPEDKTVYERRIAVRRERCGGGSWVLSNREREERRGRGKRLDYTTGGNALDGWDGCGNNWMCCEWMRRWGQGARCRDAVDFFGVHEGNENGGIAMMTGPDYETTDL